MPLKRKVLGGLVLGGMLGTAGARALKSPPPPPAPEPSLAEKALEWAKGNKKQLAIGGGAVLGTVLLARMLKRRRQRKADEAAQREQLDFERALAMAQAQQPRIQQVPVNISMDGQPKIGMCLRSALGMEKQAVLGALGRLGMGALRFGAKGLGLTQRATTQNMMKAFQSTHGRRRALDSVLQAAKAEGVKGPSLLNPLNWLSPLNTASARMTRGGRTRWLAEQASQNSKAWQRIASRMDPMQRRQFERMLKTNIKGPAGKAMSVAEALPASKPGLVSGTVAGLTVWDPVMGAVVGGNQPQIPEEPAQPPSRLQQADQGFRSLMQRLGGRMGNNAVGNWVQDNPYLAAGAGAAGAGLLGYGLYRGLVGGASPSEELGYGA